MLRSPWCSERHSTCPLFLSIMNLYIYFSRIFLRISLVILSSVSQLSSFPLPVGFNVSVITLFLAAY